MKLPVFALVALTTVNQVVHSHDCDYFELLDQIFPTNVCDKNQHKFRCVKKPNGDWTIHSSKYSSTDCADGTLISSRPSVFVDSLDEIHCGTRKQCDTITLGYWTQWRSTCPTNGLGLYDDYEERTIVQNECVMWGSPLGLKAACDPNTMSITAQYWDLDMNCTGVPTNDVSEASGAFTYSGSFLSTNSFTYTYTGCFTTLECNEGGVIDYAPQTESPKHLNNHQLYQWPKLSTRSVVNSQGAIQRNDSSPLNAKPIPLHNGSMLKLLVCASIIFFLIIFGVL
eukprot:124567_1